jgi:hypothetical protein
MWLAYVKAGTPWDLVQLLAYALMYLQYFIVTAYGTSTKANEHLDEYQFLGPGQGATDSPFAWALISLLLILLYKQTAHGCTMQDPTGQLKWKRKIDSFVDDAYLFHGILKTISAIALMQMIKHDISRWSKILWTSGGAINGIKSFYSMLIWTFDDNGIAQLAKNDQLPKNTVNIPNLSNPKETYTIKRKCVLEASKTLGVFKAADLSQTGELTNLKKKANRFARALLSCPLSHMHVWLAYWTVCIPGITYSSSTTSLTEEQCSQVEKIIKPSLVKKLGLPDTFPNLMLYGDKYFRGVGILQIFAEQGMNQTLSIMRHIRAKTTLGDQILIALRHYQNQAGISKCVLSDTRTLPHMSIPWFDTF